MNTTKAPAQCTVRRGSASHVLIPRLPTIEESKERRDRMTSLTSGEKHVDFDQVQVREYERTLGDNPSVSSGPALTIGWDSKENYEFTIDAYEQIRNPRRKKEEMAVPRNIRESILKFECGCSTRELAECVRTINQVKAHRRQTIHNLEQAHLHERMEKLRRKVGRIIGTRKSTDKEIERLWLEAGKQTSN